MKFSTTFCNKQTRSHTANSLLSSQSKNLQDLYYTTWNEIMKIINVSEFINKRTPYEVRNAQYRHKPFSILDFI